MALLDPVLLEFARLVDTEESVTEFTCEHLNMDGLLLSDQAPLNNNLIGAVGLTSGVH